MAEKCVSTEKIYMDSKKKPPDPKLSKTKWVSHLTNSDPDNLALECANHLFFGRWEIFRCLATTLTNADREPFDKKFILNLLKSFFDDPHLYCQGSTVVHNSQQLYWLSAHFYAEICDNKEEANKVVADAGFRMLLSELYSCDVKDSLAELYLLFRSYCNGNFDSILSDECHKFLVDLLSSHTALGCDVLQQLLRLGRADCSRLSTLLSCLHESLDQCLTKLDLDSGSTFRSERPSEDMSAVRSSVYRLLLLGGALASPRNPPAYHIDDSSCSHYASAPSEILHDDRNKRLVVCLQQFCERSILDTGIVFSLCLSHGGDLWLVRSLCRLEDQSRNRMEVTDAAASSANFLHLVRDRSSHLDVREMFLHSVLNGSHFLERIVIACVELIDSGDSLLAYCTLQDHLLCRLKPLVLLVAWTRVKSVVGIVRFLDAHEMLFSAEKGEGDGRENFDLTLIAACDQLARKARLVLWTLSSDCDGRKKSKARHQDVLDVLPGLTRMSALYILSRCASIAVIPREQAFESLKMCASQEEHSYENLRDEVILLSYYVMCDLSRVVEDGITLDHMMGGIRGPSTPLPPDFSDPAADAARFYAENIVGRLEEICSQVAKIFPLDYRVEILENAFALLFATHRHVKVGSVDFGESSESSDDGGQEDDRPAFDRKKVPVFGEATDAEGSTVHRKLHRRSSKEETRNRKEARCQQSIKKTRSPLPHRFAAVTPIAEAPSHHVIPSSGGTSSARSTSSGGRGLSRIGFVANELVARDMLECVRRCVNDAFAATANLAKRDDECTEVGRNLHRRLSRLSQYVSEGQWRFQLVADGSTPNDYGTFPALSPVRGPIGVVTDANGEWSWNFYGDPCSNDSEEDSDAARLGGKPVAAAKAKPTRKVSQSAIRRFRSRGIINRMLAPHESLLNMCLHQNQFVKAHEVIRVFGLEKTARASEIEFSVAYERTLRHLLKPCVATSPSINPSSRVLVRSPSMSSALPRSPWESIMDAAQFGAEVAASRESLAIDELLASHNVPSVSEWDVLTTKIGEGQTSSLLPGIPERLDWRGLVKADLAAVGCSRADTARWVLESCRGALWSISVTGVTTPQATAKREHSFHGRVSKQKLTPPPRGMLGFLDNLTLLATALSETVATDVPTQSLSCSSIRGLLLQATWPLSFRQYKVATTTWVRLRCLLEQFLALVKKEEVALAASPTSSAATSQSSSPKTTTAGSPGSFGEGVLASSGDRHPIHAVYQKLLRIAAVARLMLAEEATDSHNRNAPERIPVYMLTMFEYVKNVHSFLPRFQLEPSSLTPRSYFSVFGQLPSTFLKQLLFDTSITPTELEDFARHLNLNLLQIVVQHSCPYISAVGNVDNSQSSPNSTMHSDNLTGASNSSSNTSKSDPNLSSGQRPQRLSAGSVASVELESATLSPILLEYVHSRCWLAALIMQVLGCTGTVSAEKSSSKSSSLVGSDDAQTSQLNLIDHPVLHRFLQHRRGAPHSQQTSHAASFAFRPFVPPGHITAALDDYVRSADWVGLVEYTNGWECQGDLAVPRRDDALARLANPSTSGLIAGDLLPPWVYAVQMRDSRRRAELVLQHFVEWDAEGAMAALSTCISEPAITDELRNKVKLCLKRVQLCWEIMLVASLDEVGIAIDDAWRWQDVAHACVTDPLKLLRHLATSKRYDFIVRWTDIHDITDDVRPICNESAVLALLALPDCTPALLQKVLEDTFDVGQRFSVCQKILDHLCERPEQAESLLSVVESCDLSGVDGEPVRQFVRKKIGIKILSCLQTDNDKGRYVRLVTRPHLMIEQLLLGFKLETVQRVYHNIREDLRTFADDEFLSFDALDRLVELYASKAIDFRISKTKTRSITINDSAVLSIEEASSTEKSKRAKTFVVPMVVPTRQEWVPDSAVERCSVCEIERFSMFNRRHHCRRCGRVVCGSCSQRKSLVTGYDDVAVRICDDCHSAAVDPDNGSPDGLVPAEVSPSETLDQRLKSHFGDETDVIAVSDRIRMRHESLQLTTCSLTLDESHNRTVREEFSYEQAPNISLCLSILELHWDQRKSADYLINLAETLFTFLQPVSPNVANPEVDYAFVISLLRTVFLSSRVKFSKLPDNDRDATILYCDLCLSLADLLQILVTANCKHLIPVGDFTKAEAVSQALQRLRDRLIREERWDLALEVSTKGGMNVIGVWMAWGMTCLKFGAYASARQKFSHCLTRPVDRNRPTPSATLLGQIIQRLNNSSDRVISMASIDSVKRLRQRLHLIKSGVLQSATTESQQPLTSEIRDECWHYICTYGSHDTALAFHVQHDDYKAALRYVVEEKCLPATFVEQVVVPSLRRGSLYLIQDAVAVVDRKMEHLGIHFGALCRHLERQGLLHTLYGVQLFLRDYVRAAITCIQFYQRDARNYSDLYDRLPDLVNARHHLQTYKQQFHTQPQDPSGKRPVMTATLQEIDRYVRSIALQDEVTKFLHGKSPFWQATFAGDTSDAGSMASVSMSRESVAVKGASAVPTVFYDATSRAKVVALVILTGANVEEGFELAVSIIREYRLRAPNVFSLVAKRLLKQQRTAEVTELVRCMRALAGQSDDTCDLVLLRSISLAVSSGCDVNSADVESLIKELTDEDNRVEAQIQCGKLKSAYLLAVKKDSVELIQRILQEANRTGQTSVKVICEKWMSRRPNN